MTASSAVITAVLGRLKATVIDGASRVHASMSVKHRNRRPDDRPSLTKSMLHDSPKRVVEKCYRATQTRTNHDSKRTLSRSKNSWPL